MAQINESKLAMLRGAIALAWADGVMDDNERERLHQLIDRHEGLSYIQRDQLKKDVETQIGLDGIWEKITDVHDRAHLINIAVALFHEDGDYADLEKKAYAQINALHHDTLDIAAMESELSAMAKEAYAKEQEARDAEYEAMSAYQKAVKYLDELFG